MAVGSDSKNEGGLKHKEVTGVSICNINKSPLYLSLLHDTRGEKGKEGR